MDSSATIQGFVVEDQTAKKALAMGKEQHACRWQTKDGTYRIKQQLVLPDVRDAAGDVCMGDL